MLREKRTVEIPLLSTRRKPWLPEIGVIPVVFGPRTWLWSDCVLGCLWVPTVCSWMFRETAGRPVLYARGQDSDNSIDKNQQIFQPFCHSTLKRTGTQTKKSWDSIGRSWRVCTRVPHRGPADRADWVKIIFKNEKRTLHNREENLKCLLILKLESSNKTSPIWEFWNLW